MALAGGLQAAGIKLELLTGPLTGIYDPNGLGALLFAAPAAAYRTGNTPWPASAAGCR
jgi:hypothetical protein